jgi:hypothetical protein
LGQPLIDAADSLSFRVADLNEQMWAQATAIAINNTQVGNVEPLKGLIALRELNLYSTLLSPASRENPSGVDCGPRVDFDPPYCEASSAASRRCQNAAHAGGCHLAYRYPLVRDPRASVVATVGDSTLAGYAS